MKSKHKIYERHWRWSGFSIFPWLRQPSIKRAKYNYDCHVRVSVQQQTNKMWREKQTATAKWILFWFNIEFSRETLRETAIRVPIHRPRDARFDKLLHGIGIWSFSYSSTAGLAARENRQLAWIIYEWIYFNSDSATILFDFNGTLKAVQCSASSPSARNNKNQYLRMKFYGSNRSTTECSKLLGADNCYGGSLVMSAIYFVINCATAIHWIAGHHKLWPG